MTDPVENVPQHAFEVRISIGGDEWPYVLRTMEELARYLRVNGTHSNLASGGGGGSHSVTVVQRDVSPTAYHVELAAWMERERAQREAERAAFALQTAIEDCDCEPTDWRCPHAHEAAERRWRQARVELEAREDAYRIARTHQVTVPA